MMQRVRCFLSPAILPAILTILILAGCSADNKSAEAGNKDGKLKVYTSFYAMYDFTRAIGGDKINLVNLTPPGTEPHDWEPSTREMAALEEADLLIYNGRGMEAFVDKIKKSVSNPNLLFVETSADVPVLESSGQVDDPHVWLNPLYAKMQMESIKNALVEKDGENREYYEENFAALSERISRLDKDYKETLSGFTKRDIVTAHEAYIYLCDAYQLHQEAIEGILADSEPSPGRMAQIIRFVEENDVRVIFYEELLSPKVAEAIAKETGAETAVLNPFEGAEGEDYFEVMYDNLESLKRALE